MIKGIISRNFEFWKNQPVIKGKEGGLSIGYGYANLLVRRLQCARFSHGHLTTYWSFRISRVSELQEEPYPILAEKHNSTAMAGSRDWWSAEAAHHVFLSSSQYSASRLLYHNQEKYGKFAYSTYFGFNSRMCGISASLRLIPLWLCSSMDK